MPETNDKHWPVLDGLRGVAIIGVSVFHVALFACLDAPTEPTPASRVLMPLVGLGAHGVDLFFVLSGFLITDILLKAEGAPLGLTLRAFYARRVLRIFPAYYATLAALFALGALPSSCLGWLLGYASNLLIAGWGWSTVPRLTQHFWSLAVEEQFYLFWPAMVLLLGRRKILYVCLAMIVTSPLARTFAGDGDTHRLVSTLCRLDGLGVGASIAALTALGQRDTLIRWSRRALVSVTVAGATLFAIAPQAKLAWQPPVCLLDLEPLAMRPWLTSWGLSLFNIAAGATLVLAMHSKALARPLSWPPLRLIGRRSYAMYLVHQPLLEWALAGHATFGRDFPLLVSVGLLGASLLVASISWRLLEEPVLALKSRFPMPRRSTSNTSVAAGIPG